MVLIGVPMTAVGENAIVAASSILLIFGKEVLVLSAGKYVQHIPGTVKMANAIFVQQFANTKLLPISTIPNIYVRYAAKNFLTSGLMALALRVEEYVCTVITGITLLHITAAAYVLCKQNTILSVLPIIMFVSNVLSADTRKSILVQIQRLKVAGYV